MKPLLLTIATAFLISPLGATLSLAAEGPFLALDFDAALKKATVEKKLVLVDFYTTWCGPCKMLDKQTWSDAAVAALLVEKAVALKIDAEKEPALASRFGVEAYPTIAVIRADGTLQDKYVGFMPPAEFIEHFNATLAGKNSLDLANEAVEKAKKADAHAEVKARYDRAKELAQRGKKEEALQEYLWCFDEGMVKVPSYAGVRLSYLLSEIMTLSRTFPAAKEALVQRRDAAREAFQKSPTATRDAQVYGALNQTLGAGAETLAEFDKLPKGDARRRALGTNIYEQLIARKSYADALEAQPGSVFEQMLKHYEGLARGEGYAAMRPDMVELARRQLIEQTTQRAEVLNGAGRSEDARKLVVRLIEFQLPADALEQFRAALKNAGIDNLLPDTSGQQSTIP